MKTSDRKLISAGKDSSRSRSTVTAGAEFDEGFGDDWAENNSNGLRKPRTNGLLGRVLSFGLIGGFVFVVGFVVLFAAVQFLHLNAYLAYFIQAIVSIELNFFLNHFITWRDRGTSSFRSMGTSWLKFHVTRIFTVALNQGFYSLLVVLGVQYLLANVIGTIVFTIVNYLVGDLFVFNAQTSPSQVRTADFIDPNIPLTTPTLTSILRP